jgi:hypothetical protein
MLFEQRLANWVERYLGSAPMILLRTQLNQ